MEWFQQVPVVVRALIYGLSAAAGSGIFLRAVLHKITPDAKDRMEDARLRRVEDDDRIAHLEAELKASNERYYAEREAHIATKERMVATDARLEMLSARLDRGGKSLLTPDDVAQDRLDDPPGEPHDDREGA